MGFLASGLIGAGVGAGIGAGAGALATIGQNREAARNRRRFRRGLRRAENVTASQVLDVANDPFNVAAKNFLGGLFGVDQFAGGVGEPAFRGEQGVNVGGRVFFTDPGRGFGGRLKRRGRRVGKQLSRAIEAGDASLGADALEQFAGNKGLRTSALRALQRRGFGLEDVNALDAQLTPQIREAQANVPVSPGGSQGTAFDPFTQNIAKQLNQQLALGGLGGGIGENVAAALGTGLARTQFQLSLIPQLQQFAAQEQTLRNQFLGQNAQFEVQRATGGVGVFGAANQFQNQNVLGGALQGGLAGLTAGAQIGLGAAALQQPQPPQEQSGLARAADIFGRAGGFGGLVNMFGAFAGR